MKETVLDVLMYLFENYQEGEFSDAEYHDTLREELLAAGFPDDEVGNAFAWLDGLAEQRQLPLVFGPYRSTRIYTRDEIAKISNERSEEHTSELQSTMRTSLAVLGLKNTN